MRPARTAILVLGAILALGIQSSAVSASSTPHEAHLTKDCSTYTGVTPSLCTIAASDLDVVPIGTKVWYLGPVLTNTYFLSSNVSLDAGHGNVATGYCIFESKPSTGICTFWKGTGTLTRFTATFDVTIDEQKLWHWDGIYYFADATESVGASPGGSATAWR
jgi:hypothetical protein